MTEGRSHLGCLIIGSQTCHTMHGWSLWLLEYSTGRNENICSWERKKNV